MQIHKINNQASFQARFSSDIVTKEVLKSVKKDAISNNNTETVDKLVKLFREKCPNKNYRLSMPDNKEIAISGEIEKTYRQTEPIKGSLSSSFMRLIGQFVNNMSSHV